MSDVKFRYESNSISLQEIYAPSYPNNSGLEYYGEVLQHPKYSIINRDLPSTSHVFNIKNIKQTDRNTVNTFWDTTILRGYYDFTAIDHRKRLLFDASWLQWLETWKKKNGGLHDIEINLQSPFPWTPPLFAFYPFVNDYEDHCLNSNNDLTQGVGGSISANSLIYTEQGTAENAAYNNSVSWFQGKDDSSISLIAKFKTGEINSDAQVDIIKISDGNNNLRIYVTKSGESSSSESSASSSSSPSSSSSSSSSSLGFSSESSLGFSSSSSLGYSSSSSLGYSSSSSIEANKSSSSSSVRDQESSSSQNPTYQYAYAFTANTGAIKAGTLASTYAEDSSYFQLSETSMTPGFDYDFEFRNVPNDGYLFEFVGRYQGNIAHNVKCRIWNENLSQFDNLTADAQDLPSSATDYIVHIPMPADLTDYYYDNNKIKIKIIHTSAGNPTHNLYIDSIYLEDASLTSSSSPSGSSNSSSLGFSSSSSLGYSSESSSIGSSLSSFSTASSSPSSLSGSSLSSSTSSSSSSSEEGSPEFTIVFEWQKSGQSAEYIAIDGINTESEGVRQWYDACLTFDNINNNFYGYLTKSADTSIGNPGWTYLNTFLYGTTSLTSNNNNCLHSDESPTNYPEDVTWTSVALLNASEADVYVDDTKKTQIKYAMIVDDFVPPTEFNWIRRLFHYWDSQPTGDWPK